MENFDPEETQTQEIKLIVTEEMRSYIYETTKWAKILAIVGFVISAFLFIGSFGIASFINSNPNMAAQLGPLGKGGSLGVTVLYLIFAFLYFYPSLLLSKFSNKGKQGILFGDQASLSDALLNIKSLFKYMGILTLIVVFSYVALVLVVGLGMARI